MRFSVIMPLFNKAPYVAKAIESVLSQTFGDYELIVMDDGSTDESYDIALKTIDGHENGKIYRQQNAGVSMARNNAVTLSHGDYLCFLDADDWWAPTFLEEMTKFIDEYPEAGIYGTNYTIVNETKHKTRVAPVSVDSGFEKGYINYCQVYSKNLAMPLWTGAVCIPRWVFNEMNGFPKGIKLGEDFLLWIRIALKYKVAFLNTPFSFYNQDSESQWRGTGYMQEPKRNMLWNLSFLEDEEKKNADYKTLVDKLRVSGLISYYLSKQYRTDAVQELKKVDWEKQKYKNRMMYKYPIWYLKATQVIKKTGSTVKNCLGFLRKK